MEGMSTEQIQAETIKLLEEKLDAAVEKVRELNRKLLQSYRAWSNLANKLEDYGEKISPRDYPG